MKISSNKKSTEPLLLRIQLARVHLRNRPPKKINIFTILRAYNCAKYKEFYFLEFIFYSIFYLHTTYKILYGSV